MPKILALFEHAAGIGLFNCQNIIEVIELDQSVIELYEDFDNFSKQIQLSSFFSFPSITIAHETMEKMNNGEISEFLQNFLSNSLAPFYKDPSIILFIADEKL